MGMPGTILVAVMLASAAPGTHSAGQSATPEPVTPMTHYRKVR